MTTAVPLSRRLAAVAELVPRGSRVADIGTDHGLLALWLVETGRAAHAIATDRHPTGPRLDLARSSLSVPPSRIELRVGDGLRCLAPADEVDVVVVSGLGGHSIIRILSDPARLALEVSRWILQPQTRPPLVRRWLLEHGYRIVDERLPVDRGRAYVVIAAEVGAGEADLLHPDLSPEEVLEVGPVLLRNADRVAAALWRRRADLLDRIVPRTPPGARRERALRRLAEARRVLRALGG